MTALEQTRALWRKLQAHHEATPNRRDYERRAEFEAAYDAHEAAGAAIEAEMEALEDAVRDEHRARQERTRP